MENHTLVVSNPPHGEVDPRSAARCFGLSPAEARMKANFAAPEIWLAGNREAAEQGAGSLEDAGMRVMLLSGSDVASVPIQQPATSFAFEKSRLVVQLPETKVELAYDTPLIGVFCRAPAGASTEPRRSASMADGIGKGSSGMMINRFVGSTLEMAEALERSTFLDLYVGSGDDLRRISIARDFVDFSGLGDAKQFAAGGNMTAFVTECRQRFSRLRMDERLVNIRPRSRPMVGFSSGQEDRRLYSFGTQALSNLLEAISPELKDATQFELGSRLGYLLTSAKVSAVMDGTSTHDSERASA